MSTRHKHYDVIVAFAEGKAIQYRNSALDKWKDWERRFSPSFDPHYVTEYRIKPQKAWRWVVKHDGVLAVSTGHYPSAEALETVLPHLIALQPVLSTEKEML